MGCCAWLCAQICAFLSSLVILVFDFVDLAAACILVFESGVVPGTASPYVTGVPANVIVASYGGALALLAGLSCLGVGLKSKACLCAAVALAFLGFLGELGVACVVMFDGDLATSLGLDIPKAWGLVLAAASARHVLRLVFSKSLASSRNVFQSLRARRQGAEDAERSQQLSQRLLERQQTREDMRRHFDDKYFGGKTVTGEPSAPPSRPSTELPSFLLRGDRDLLSRAADDEPYPSSFEV